MNRAVRALVLTVSLACACGSARDEADQLTLSQLELRLAETKLLVDARTEREAELAQLEQKLAEWAPLDKAQLLALAGEGASIASDRQAGLYRVMIFTTQRGTGQDALRFAR
ncbi:MAG: hypothetical protein JNM17_04520, partial [Archangium sp.]|nr:hypothetical protein [Archangium sp.]